MQINGNFVQTGTAVFAPAPATEMLFMGTSAQTITLANGQSSLPNLVIQNTVGVTLNPLTLGGVIPLTNTVVLTTNAKLMLAPNTQASITVPVGAVAIPALNLLAGSVLTLNSNALLRFGVPTPGCVLHQGPPAASIVLNGGTISTSTQCSTPTP
jgi:hypothetical protein